MDIGNEEIDLRQKDFLPCHKLTNPSFMEESVEFTFLYQTSGNHATEPSTVGHAISERRWKSTFDFTEFVNN